MIRIGNGIDFHKLEKNFDRKLIIGGVEIQSELALVGHSDADVLLHAIADSFLGAISLGDIGELFSDLDPKNKDLDSSIILKKAYSLITEKGYIILNIDSTIICEKPKITPYKFKIRESISNRLDINIEQISIKATTTERMGALGREEGIGVFTTTLLQKKIV